MPFRPRSRKNTPARRGCKTMSVPASPPGSLPDDSRRLQALLRMTEAMEAAARDAEWERLFELEAKRREMLQTTFPLRDTPDGKTAQTLRSILEKDQRIMAQVQETRDALGLQLQNLGRGRQASRAYLATQSG